MASDPRKLRPAEMCRLLNSTDLGEVINDYDLRKHRQVAGHRVGDDRTVDLLRYTAWLVRQRHIENQNDDDELVVKTTDELSRLYDLTPAMIKGYWFKDGTFPGKPGIPGSKRGGRFVISEIDNWVLKKDAARKTGPPSKAAARAAERLGVELHQKTSTKDKLIDVELQLAEIKLLKQRGLLVDKEVVKGVLVRQHSMLLQTVRQLPHMLGDILPADLDTDVRNDFMRRAEVQVEKALGMYSEMIETEGFIIE